MVDDVNSADGIDADSSELPHRVLDLVRAYQAGGITAADCVSCSSPCCAHGGFAILENVVAIFERYQRGELIRTDYEFPPGMSFREFVLEYFDVYRYDVPESEPVRSILFFHMRSLSPDGNTISIPPAADVAGYCEARQALFTANTWMNTGCVFLSHKLNAWPDDDRLSCRHCILHTPESGKSITAKPIDCVFHTCNTPREARTPTGEQTDAWFRALADAWPNSVERFRQLVDDDRR